jgi:hypothetical protein
MKKINILIMGITISFVIYAKENVPFEQIGYNDYSNGLVYLELKWYRNNQKLANEYKEKVKELPTIQREEIGENIIYLFKTHVIIKENNEVGIIMLKIKFTNDIFQGQNDDFFMGLSISENEMNYLVENIDDYNKFFVTNEYNDLITETDENNIIGNDIIMKKLLYGTASDMDDYFKHMYALTVFWNYKYLNTTKLNDELFKYLKDF